MSEEEKKKKKGLTVPSLMICLEARDAEGNTLNQIRKPANSWLYNFYEILQMLIAPHLTHADLKSYGEWNTMKYYSFHAQCWDELSGGKSQIGVGDSDRAFTKMQSKLEGSNVYWGEISDYTKVANKATFKATISCVNALTVKEVGLRWDKALKTPDVQLASTVMIERTVLPAEDQVDVPTGGSIIATYEMAMPL